MQFCREKKLHRVAATKIAGVNGPLDEISSKNDAPGSKESEILHDEPESGISNEKSEERQVIKEIQNDEILCTLRTKQGVRAISCLSRVISKRALFSTNSMLAVSCNYCKK